MGNIWIIRTKLTPFIKKNPESYSMIYVMYLLPFRQMLTP